MITGVPPQSVIYRNRYFNVGNLCEWLRVGATKPLALEGGLSRPTATKDVKTEVGSVGRGEQGEGRKGFQIA